MYICIYIYMTGHIAVQQKLTGHYKSTIIQKIKIVRKKKKSRKKEKIRNEKEKNDRTL